jgi:hypothetical protein
MPVIKAKSYFSLFDLKTKGGCSLLIALFEDCSATFGLRPNRNLQMGTPID